MSRSKKKVEIMQQASSTNNFLLLIVINYLSVGSGIHREDIKNREWQTRSVHLYTKSFYLDYKRPSIYSKLRALDMKIEGQGVYKAPQNNTYFFSGPAT